VSLLSSKILTNCCDIVQTKCLPQIGAARKDLFEFGLKALSFKPLVSLNANARSVITNNRNTAESTMTRLLHKKKLTEELGSVVGNLNLVTPASIVNFDHTEHDGVMAFVGAMQTRKGRAIPCFVDASISGKLPAHEDALPRKRAMREAYNAQGRKLTAQTVAGLKAFRDQCGFWPSLVFDRWFAYEGLVRLLARNKATFYVRMKAGRFVELFGEQVRIRDLDSSDQTVKLYGRRLRIVMSKKTKAWKEPWVILTSDFSSSAQRIIKIYYHRFEIEESFKDIKHIQDLSKIQVQKPLSFEIILWFIILGIILMFLAGKQAIGIRKLLSQNEHPKKQLSWYRRLMELLEQHIWEPVHELLTLRPKTVEG